MLRSQKTNRYLTILSIAIRYLAGGSQRGPATSLSPAFVPLVSLAARDSAIPRRKPPCQGGAARRGGTLDAAARRGRVLSGQRATRGTKAGGGEARERAPRRLSARFTGGESQSRVCFGDSRGYHGCGIGCGDPIVPRFQLFSSPLQRCVTLYTFHAVAPLVYITDFATTRFLFLGISKP